MSVHISLTLEASEMFLSLHMIFSLESAALVWDILERILGFDPSLETIAPRYLKFSTSSSLWPVILISLWKPLGLFVIPFVLSGPISILYLLVVLSRRSIRMPASYSSSAFFILLCEKFPDLSCMVVDLPCFSVVRFLTSLYAFLLLFFLKHASTSWHWPCIQVPFAIFISVLIFLLITL